MEKESEANSSERSWTDDYAVGDDVRAKWARTDALFRPKDDAVVWRPAKVVAVKPRHQIQVQLSGSLSRLWIDKSVNVEADKDKRR